LPAAAAGPQGASGGSQPQFKVSIDYVHVDVAVTDQRGNFVRDLSRDDFEVSEDGKPQQVASFAFVDAPVYRRAAGAAATTPAETDVRTNEMDAGGRVYVLLLDDLHVDPLRSARVKRVAREFVERHFGPNDVAAVIHTSGRSDAAQDFTSRPSLLLEAIDKFVGRKLRSRLLESLDEYQRGRPASSSADARLERVIDPLDVQRADQAQRMLKTLTNLGEVLARAPGRRKTMLLFSEGIDYPLQEGVTQTASGLTAFTSPYASSVLRNFQQAVGAAARANVSIYSIDPRGLATTGDETIEASSFPENPHLGLTPAAFDDELRQAQDTLRLLSEQTGGLASVTSNDFAGAFDRLVSDSGTYYMLGYQSTNRRSDGSYRRITVRVKRPGVQVRARAGYTAAQRGKSEASLLSASNEPSAVLREALNAPLPVAALPIRIFAAAFRGAADESVAVGIEVDARGFRFVQKDNLYTDKVEIALVAMDSQARFKTGDRQTLQLQLKPETYRLVQAHGLRVFFRLNLSPGRYQLRAAAQESGSGTSGSAFYDLTVPEFHRLPLSISGVVIASSGSASTPTPAADPVFQGALPSPPTGVRTFYPEETLTLLYEIYHQGGSVPTSVDLVATVRDADGTVRFSSQDQVVPQKLAAGGAGLGYSLKVPLTGMPPGAYTLRVEARSRPSADQPVRREVPFTIAAPSRRAP
jgi:VWFA-related protein